MGVELIRKAVCDRCGKECYHITEKTINQDVCEQYKIERKRIVENIYHYTEMALTSFDSRFETGEPKGRITVFYTANKDDWFESFKTLREARRYADEN